MTAKEIYRALENNRNSSGRIVCFFRELLDVNELDSRYRETENSDETSKLLDDMKIHLRQSIASSDIYTYKVSRGGEMSSWSTSSSYHVAAMER